MDRYRNIKLGRTWEGKQFYVNPIYPPAPLSPEDLYVITTDGDRFDLLAKMFYGDQSLWWLIASANTPYADSLVLPPGVQIRIPHSSIEAREEYERQNRF